VLIAAPELLPTLKKRPIEPESELLAFPDVDALRALEVISKRHPRVVALERAFSTTPRGSALIRRIKADPSLTQSEIRIVSLDEDEAPVEVHTIDDDLSATAGAEAAPLDLRGTRRAARSKIVGTVDVVVDGNAATLVDLSKIGAQVVSATVLRPTQRLRVTLGDDKATIRFNAIVAWASFEIPPMGARYRAGLEFIDADAELVEALRIRHAG
jgi:hypothetical protein